MGKYYCAFCETSHPDFKKRAQCPECGRYFCKDSIMEAKSVGRNSCPYCDYSLSEFQWTPDIGTDVTPEERRKESLEEESWESPEYKVFKGLEKQIGEPIPGYDVKDIIWDSFGFATDGMLITELELESRKLTYLPETLGRLTDLKVLRLWNNQLTSLPESLGQLTNLKELDIRGNMLRSIPESIGQLTNLQLLRLSGNQLSSLPETLGQMINLKELQLRDNQLTSLPESLSQLTNLRRLDLGSNQSLSLPQSLGQLTNLSVLDLFNMKLTSLPETFCQLTNLRILELAYNEFRQSSLSETLSHWLSDLKKKGCQIGGIFVEYERY